MPLLTLLMPLLTKVLDFIPDPAEKVKQLQMMIDAVTKLDTSQLQVDQAEASNQNLFVSGWRPGIGWICTFALAYQYILMPFLSWGFIAMHLPVPKLPGLDENLWQLTMGMLGMSGLRTIEKFGGKTK